MSAGLTNPRALILLQKMKRFIKFKYHLNVINQNQIEFLNQRLTFYVFSKFQFHYRQQQEMIENQIYQDFLILQQIQKFNNRGQFYTFFQTYYFQVLRIMKSNHSKLLFNKQSQNKALLTLLMRYISQALEEDLNGDNIRKAIIIVNCILNIDLKYIEEFRFTCKNLNTLSKYFTSFFIYYQKPHVEKQLGYKTEENKDNNFELYSIIYLITLIIIQTKKVAIGKDIMTIFFTDKLVTQFFRLNTTYINKKQMYRLISIILMFVIRKIKIKDYEQLLKQFLLVHLNFIKQTNSQLSFLFSLRILVEDKKFTRNEIIKYKIQKFLIDCLTGQESTNNHFNYACDVIRTLIKSQRIFADRFCNLGILQILKQNFKLYPRVTYIMLDSFQHFMNKEKKIQFAYNFVNMIMKEDGNMIYALKSLSVFIMSMELKDILEILEQKILDKMQKMAKQQMEIQFINQVFGVFYKLLEFVSQIHQKYSSNAQIILKYSVLSKIYCMQLMQTLKNHRQSTFNQIYFQFTESYPMICL